MNVFRYVTASGKDVVGEWLAELKDARTRAKIVARIDRLSVGNFGDCKTLAAGYLNCGSTGARLPRLLRIGRQSLRPASLLWRQEHADLRHQASAGISE